MEAFLLVDRVSELEKFLKFFLTTISVKLYPLHASEDNSPALAGAGLRRVATISAFKINVIRGMLKSLMDAGNSGCER